MPSRPERRRRRMTLLALASLGTAGAFAFACGIDSVASKDFPTPLADATPIPEANLPPMNDGNASDASPPDATLDAEAGCPTGHGDMVEVHDAGGLTFCIDSTEVTNDAYAAFIEATDGGSVDSGVFDAGSPPGCSSNTSYAVTTAGNTDFPVVNVSWCDAYAYCAWAGKRLCGHLTGADASTGEWYGACSNGGTQGYPYGPAYVAGTCNDTDVEVMAVKSFPGCTGGVDGGLFDMNGNVSELVDSCSATGCTVMGGNYSKPGACSLALELSDAKTNGAFYVGFRCCSDL